jgi:transposase-like protein
MEKKGSRKTQELGTVSPPERSAGGLTAVALPSSRPIPDPEVPAKARRRGFTTEYKLSILRETDACKHPGEIGALLRREGLYSSHLTLWRKQRAQGILGSRRRGPKPTRPDPHTLELERENRRLKKQLQRAQTIIDVQKKVSTLLGIPLKRPPRAGND